MQHVDDARTANPVRTAVFALPLALVLAVLWQVATRYAFGSPSSWTEELARYLMVWIGLLGGAFAVGQRIHLAVELVRLKGGAGRFQEVSIQVVVVAFALFVLCIGGALLVELSFDLGQTRPVTDRRPTVPLAATAC